MFTVRGILSVFFLVPFLSIAHNDPESRIGFIENKNQFHENVLFQGHFNHYTVFLEKNRFTFLLENAEDLAARHDIIKAPLEERMDFFIRAHAYRVNFSGANENVTMEKDLAQDFTLNYFIGANESEWASGVRSYKKVKYLDIYDGIDLMTVVDKGNLKYDFIVSPGADPNAIVLDFEGLDDLAIVDGDLVMTTSVGEVRELRPFAYQQAVAGLQPVLCEYALEGNQVRFTFPAGYNVTKELVIDPVVIASTLSGTPGFSNNFGHGATFDLAGNIYSHGTAFGTEYPVTTGAMQTNSGGGSTDIAISKYNPTGTDLIYATYIGGNDGDVPHSLITTQFEELYVYGTTNSSDYPISAIAYDTEYNDPGISFAESDIVITKISADGTQMLGSTFVGGSGMDGRNFAIQENFGDNFRGEIVLDQFGFPYISTTSSSDDFPTTVDAYETTHQGGQDAVVFKMSPDLSEMLWATYLGTSNDDTGFGLRVADNGQVVVCGSTKGNDFPTTVGAYQPDLANADGILDGFIARFNSDGTDLLISTYIGTSSSDQAFFIEIDDDQDVWIYGQTEGDWPTMGGGYSTTNGKLYVVKFNPNLDELLVSSRIGPGNEWSQDAVPVAFLVDKCDRIYICGYMAETGFELTDDALYTTGGFILCAWEEDMSELSFSSYYGGNHVDGGTSRFDKSGIVYQGVCNGGFFPTNADAWATDQETDWDIGVFKIDFELAGVSAAITTYDDISGCAPLDIQFSNFSIGDQFVWNFGDGSPESNDFEPSHTYTEPGSYTISLISYDSLTCNLADTAYLYIEIGSSEAFNPTFSYELDCETSTVELTNETNASFLDYEWEMGDGNVYSTENVTHTYDELGVYNIVLTATDNVCDNTEMAEAEIEVFGALTAEIDNETVEACDQVEVVFENLSNGQTYMWDFGDGTTSNEENPTHTFTGPGVFEVTLIAYHVQTCNPSDTATMTVAVGAEQNIEAIFDVIQTDCENLIVETQNQSEGTNLDYEWDMGDGTTYQGENITHQYTDIGIYTITLNIEDTLCLITEDAELDVSMSNAATANAVLENTEGCPPLDVEFGNLSNGQDYFWDFGDGSTSTEFIPEHTYETPGEYEVMLVVYGSAECPGQDTAYADVIVTDNTVDALFDYEQSGLCADYTADFVSQSEGDDLQLNWTFNGNEVNGTDTYTYVFPGSGTYTVILTATEPNCLNTDTHTEEVTMVSGFNVFIGPDRDICYDQNSILLETGLESTGYSFNWSTGAQDVPAIEVTEPGTYSVLVSDGTCSDESEVEIGQGTQFESSYSLEICEGRSELITIPAYGQSYEWQTGQTSQSISITQAGDYGYSFIDQGGCLQSDTIHVSGKLSQATLYIPNSFTPNGDGINEIFHMVGEEIEQFELLIFNRWGELIFETEDHTQGWNGSIQNNGEYYVPDGVYPYILKVKSFCKADNTEYRGMITILR